jgi:hypothetical protein
MYGQPQYTNLLSLLWRAKFLGGDRHCGIILEKK